MQVPGILSCTGTETMPATQEVVTVQFSPRWHVHARECPNVLQPLSKVTQYLNKCSTFLTHKVPHTAVKYIAFINTMGSVGLLV